MSHPAREDTSGWVTEVTIDPVAFNRIRNPGEGAKPAFLIELVDEAQTRTNGHVVDTAPPTLDPATVGRLIQLGSQAGEDLMGQLATLFVADADMRMAALRAALAQANRASVAMNSHTLNGASGCLGATELAHLCAQLEQDCGTDTLEAIGVSVDEIEAELARVRTALDERGYS